jgi:hypothetical protein
MEQILAFFNVTFSCEISYDVVVFHFHTFVAVVAHLSPFVKIEVVHFDIDSI